MEIEVQSYMRLYKLSVKGLVLMSLVVSIFLALSFLLSFFLAPNFYSPFSRSIPYDISTTNIYSTSIQGLTKLHQEMWLSLVPVKSVESPGIILSQVNVTVQLFGAEIQESGVKKWISISEESSSTLRAFSCLSETTRNCSEVTILHIPFLYYPEYMANVTIQQGSDHPVISGTGQIIWTIYNDQFTLFEIWFRFVLLLITLIIYFCFAMSLRKTRFRDWSIEQKWLWFLLACLIGFNNPFFAFSINYASPFLSFFDVFNQSNFIIFLMFYWLAVFHGIRVASQQRYFCGFYLPKLLIVGFLWFALVGVDTWERLHQLDDPTYKTAQEIPGFKFFQATFGIFLVIYLFYLAYHIFRAAGDLRSLPFLDVRFKFLVGFTFFVLSCCLGAVFGSVFLEYDIATSYLAFYILFNTYVYVLAFAYSSVGSSKPHGNASSNRRTGGGHRMIAVESDDDDDDAEEIDVNNDGHHA